MDQDDEIQLYEMGMDDDYIPSWERDSENYWQIEWDIYKEEEDEYLSCLIGREDPRVE